MSVWQQEQASHPMVSRHACLATGATTWERGTLGCCYRSYLLGPHSCTPSWIQGPSKHVLPRLVAAGVGSGTPHGPLSSSTSPQGCRRRRKG